uniref:hypothetical protein n=1 Tax=uncultured Sulfitobacter sp. TaxID=191468 RepID=UPI0026245742
PALVACWPCVSSVFLNIAEDQFSGGGSKAPTQPFYKAYDRAAVTLAKELNITQLGAKAMMKDAYHQQHGTDLYEKGKALEEKFHTPVREAEKEARIAERTTSRTQSQQR